MNDLISRQVAIDGVKRLSLGETDATRLAMRIGDYLKRLSSAQPEKVCIANITLSEEQILEAVEKAKNEVVRVLLDEQPTADVRENVKGKWIIKTDGFVIKRVWGVCSECGNTLDFSGVNAGRGDANFCPNCGADMRGDQT